MSKKERNPDPPLDKFMAKRLRESRKAEANYQVQQRLGLKLLII